MLCYWIHVLWFLKKWIYEVFFISVFHIFKSWRNEYSIVGYLKWLIIIIILVVGIIYFLIIIVRMWLFQSDSDYILWNFTFSSVNSIYFTGITPIIWFRLNFHPYYRELYLSRIFLYVLYKCDLTNDFIFL